MRIWIWDILTAAVIVLFAVLAYKRGFLRTLAELFGTAVSFAVAWIYSEPAAQKGYDLLLRDGIEKAVQEGVVQYGMDSLDNVLDKVDGILTTLPTVVANAIRSELDADTVEVWYQNIVRANSGNIAKALTDGVVAPIVTAMLQMLAFCLIFMFCGIIMRLLARLLGGVRRIPLIGSVDGVLGAVLGAVKGALYVFFAAAVLWLLIRLSGDALPFVTQSELSQTHLFSVFFSTVSSFGITV